MNALRPDLAKFRHLGIFLKSLAIILRVHLAFGKTLNLLWQNFYPIGLIYVIGNGQILNKQSTHLVTLFVTHKMVADGGLSRY